MNLIAWQRNWSLFLVGMALIALPSLTNAQNIERSWYHLTTGNGHGFQIFDRNAGRLTDFLEHPYRYVAPPDERRDGGIGRRDLAHDIYFGLGINGSYEWLTDLTDVEYEEQTHIIKAQVRRAGADIQIRYFAPFGLSANGMVMLATVTNTSSEPMDLTIFAKPNLKLGRGRPQPGGENEQIDWLETYGVETGPGGGHAIYIPIGGHDALSCGADAEVYAAIAANGTMNDSTRCQGNDQVLVSNKQFIVEPGGQASWGLAVLFVNDNPNEPQAADFRDDRTVEDIVNLWATFAGDADAATLYSAAVAEFDAWRVSPQSLGLDELSDDEIRLWRQSETVMRMGQVLEPVQDNRRNHGMFLAALPIGEWHTGWVRDGAYAIVGQAMTGHVDEARWGVDFLLGAWAGFFSSPEYLGRDYRISSVRYYGNGKEEGDFNFFGPNVETDGFGLTLWAARAYMHYSCDADWLQSRTLHGDTVFEALTQVAADIDALTSNDLPVAECSIWEVHWGHRKVFTYTAATMIRGLYDFAAIADVAGRSDLAVYYRERAAAILEASKVFLVNNRTKSFASYREAASSDVFVDGSTVEMLHWGLVEPGDELFEGTLQYYERLRTAAGGYRRLEERLSLNGEPQAGTYDLSEWILLDIRIGEIFRRAGQTARADELLNKVTEAALVNDLLIPELYQPDQYGVYTGVVPMVGYGAGAWQMGHLERIGRGAPGINAGWQHCANQPDPGAGGTGGEPMTGAGGEGGAGGSDMPGTGGSTGGDDPFAGLGGSGGSGGQPGSPTPQQPAEVDPFSNDEDATFCSASSGQGSDLSWLLWLITLVVVRRAARGDAHVA